MNIIDTQYTLDQKAYEIYVSGCAGNPHCEGCHTPWTWDFQIGKNWKEMKDRIRKTISSYSGLIDKVRIFGGEPLDQDMKEMESMLEFIHSINSSLPIWIFTRYELEEALAKASFLETYVMFIKTGPYKPALGVKKNLQYGVNLATSNQKIWKKDAADGSWKLDKNTKIEYNNNEENKGANNEN